MPPKMKISINLGAAAPPAVAPALTMPIPVEAAVEAVTSMKRDRDEELEDEKPASINVKRIKQEIIQAVTVKEEPVAEDEMNQPMVHEAHFSATERKWVKPWISKAEELLEFMDLQDNLNFFRVPSAPGQSSVSLVRAQLGDGIYDSFEDFLNSLRLVYRSADKYIGTDVYKQSLKLLESLDTKLQKMSDPVAGVKEELLLPYSESEDDTGPAVESDDDAPIDVKYISKEDLMDDVRYTKETAASDDDDDDEVQRRVRLRSSFQDKYENHPDHAHRPFWVCLMVRKEYDGQENKRAEMETHVFFEFYKIQSKEKAREAENFILSIAEPVNRPSFIHEYKLTVTSLYAAVTIGKSTEDIINELTRQSKNILPAETVHFIEKHTRNIGKLELVDSGSDNLTLIVYDQLIAQKMLGSGDLGARLFELGLRKMDGDLIEDGEGGSEAWKREFDEDGIMRSNQGTTTRFTLTAAENCTQICKVLLEFGTPLPPINHIAYPAYFFFSSTYSVINLYDFKNDTSVREVPMKPRSEASLRPYQDECLSKIFSNGRARSGIIVLPCGAGKTLVGVSVASLIQRDTVVLCSGAVAVRQWAEQFQMWTTVKKECVIEFTSQIALDEIRMRSGVIVITTYSMFRRGIKSGKQEANPGAKRIVGHNWGLLILDEVHMAPAEVTEDVMRHMTKVKCKVGLTATLVREDAKVSSLDILVGPKLYEAKWMALAENGYIARVRCLEVMCPMTSEFSRRYLEATDFRAKMRLWTLNPNKYLACLYILKLHKERQDKVLIFIDDLVTLHSYADQLMGQGFSVKAMHGQTPEKERNEMIKTYKGTQGFAVLLLSSVGDVAIDLPEASVLIEVAAHFGSRRQEAQRLGRILRAKANLEGMFNASFYVLVSKDTGEMYFAPKRQAYLVAQGYAYTAVCMRGPGEEEVSVALLRRLACGGDALTLVQLWGEDTGIDVKFIQKLENYHNEKKDYQEKQKRDAEEARLKRDIRQRDKKSHKILNVMSRK